MSDHDDFLDEYIEYRIYEDSMKNAGKMNPSGKPTSPPPIRITKKSSDLGCGGWIALICVAIAAISIFGSCGKSSQKSYSSSYKTSQNTIHPDIAPSILAAPRQSVNLTQAVHHPRTAPTSSPTPVANPKPHPIPMTQSPIPTHRTSTMKTTMTSGIMGMRRITTMSTNSKKENKG